MSQSTHDATAAAAAVAAAAAEAEHHLFLPLEDAPDFSLADHGHAHAGSSIAQDEEIALEALRAAISGGPGEEGAGDAADAEITAAAVVAAAAAQSVGGAGGGKNGKGRGRVAGGAGKGNGSGLGKGAPDSSSIPVDVDMDGEGEGEGEGEGDEDADGEGDGEGDEVDPVPSLAHLHHTAPAILTASQAQAQSVAKTVASLAQLQQASQSFMDSMNMTTVFQGLLGSFKLLVDCNRRQAELIKVLQESVANAPGDSDPSPAGFVSKTDYDALKARYDSLATTAALSASGIAAGPTLTSSGTGGAAAGGASGTPAPRRRARASERFAGEDGKAEGTPFGDEKPGRKRRSIKLEHLVHKMANRRLGVEYTVSGFEVKGTRDLPDPFTEAPSSSSSPNGVDEFRPDFVADVTAASVAPFIAVVIEDTRASWVADYAPGSGGVGATVGAGDEDVDDEAIVRAVHTYWLRLGKRYDEQQSRLRGEVHRDELTRKRQNQYRRQQSLVARRTYAFDQSPLNFCRLRALYRTLLTIDFASPTNERPDTVTGRVYSEDEWYAYRKAAFGSKEVDAHEVVDLFWLSQTARSLLLLLDTFAADQQTRMKRKGKPKAPMPTFHLPPDLWDRSTLPVLRPKDAQGLPIPGAGGIVLFRFHVDERVQAEFPDWARELYENPPVPDEDVMLSNLNETMNAASFAHLKVKVRAAREREGSNIRKMESGLVQAILAAPDAEVVPGPHPLSQFADGTGVVDTDGAGLSDTVAAAVAAVGGGEGSGAGVGVDDTFDYSADFMSAKGLESFVALTANAPLLQPFGPGSAVQVPVTSPFIVHPAPGTPGGIGGMGIGVAGGSGSGFGSGGGAPGSGGPGSSLRARRQAKRTMSEVPGGAATPVPLAKRRRGVGVVPVDESEDGRRKNEVTVGVGEAEEAVQEVEEDEMVALGDDASFFDTL